ncbi:MAG: 50S ribosomal protein L4 [Candidatus Peregrinibacteria bacterium]
MTIDVYSSTGVKTGTAELPASLFEGPIQKGLLHQMVILQQSNRRNAIAHSKEKWEIAGSTRKIYAQKGTGRARHGAIRGNVFRGGNKSFGPKKNANFIKNMPKMMRRTALIAGLSFQAKQGGIVGLESYPETIKTKDAFTLLTKLPVELGRHILVVVPAKHEGLMLSMRNIPRVKVILVDYLNPEDIVRSQKVIFLTEAIKRAEEIFAAPRVKEKVEEVVEEDASVEKVAKKSVKKTTKKEATKKPATKKAPKTSKAK